ncbi:MAG: molybdenum cofactor synthesis domain-containing protein [Candidatus Thermoplasmatota archaeon]|nr:molybdenum cofactor synthesis domain-containing protein [Candidatus Thermoplasmatota archaeon]
MVSFTLIAITDSRTEKEDLSGNAVEDMIKEAGYEVVERKIVKNDLNRIRHAIEEADGEIVITMGGTGISSKDLTPEALKPLLDKELCGFGELFRRLSYEDIGASTIMSRAFGGVMGKKAIFCLPGSTSACVLGSGIVIKECEHILLEMRK